MKTDNGNSTINNIAPFAFLQYFYNAELLLLLLSAVASTNGGVGKISHGVENLGWA
jgi:hypothetical protein